jgi:hypothetical protein
MKTIGLMLSAAMLLGASADAQGGRRVTMLGHGASSCGQWVTDRRLNNISANSDRAWLLGYITAFNEFGGQPSGNVTAGVDVEGMVTWMDNYCQHHPLETISTGAYHLVDELRTR